MTEPNHPVLDWKPNHDDRNRLYPVTRALRAVKTRRERVWAHHVVTNQGTEGACVGHAWAGEAFADPVPVDLKRVRANVPDTANELAHFIYGMARHLDPWPGEEYDGTSTLAGAKAVQNLKLLREYRWAFTIEQVLDAIAQKGPVVLGMNWYQGMYEAPNGVLRRAGRLAGGHAILAVGYYPQSPRIPGAETVLLKNSWGTGWGDNGVAEILVDDLTGLLAEDGEACVPVSRSYGR